MFIGNISELEGKEITNPEAKNAFMKVLISPKEGWDGYVMRVFEIKEAGFTPKHSHPWPHINYVLEGFGELFLEGKINRVQAGSYAFIPSDKLHQFKNTGKQTLKFICIVPEGGHKY